jgi:hypothetical protein
MKRKFCTLILAIAFLFVTAIPAFATDFTEEMIGDKLTFDVILPSHPGLALINVQVTFDPDVVTSLGSAVNGDIFPALGTPAFNVDNVGMLFADANAMTKTGLLVSFNFEVKAAGDPKFEINIIQAIDGDVSDVTEDVEDIVVGEVVVEEVAPPPPPKTPEDTPALSTNWNQPQGGFDPGDGIPAADDTPDAPDTPVVPPVVVPPSGNEGGNEGGPGTGPGTEEPDENVKAGVALAIVPALVAAAAVAISRKRK